MTKIGWHLPGTKSTKTRKQLKNICNSLQRNFGGGPANLNWSIRVGHSVTYLNAETSDELGDDTCFYRMLAWAVVWEMGKELMGPNARNCDGPVV